ncbi:MAG: tetratricopeptide repeat protein, partial [Luteolibacter sp.]
MKFHSLLLLASLATSLSGGQAAHRQQLGDEALAAGLWEIAASHYEAVLSSPSLDQSAQAAAILRLAEARLRDGRPSETLELLEQPAAADHPETSLWKGLAMAAIGKTAEAITILTPLTADPLLPFHADAVFTIANLQLAQGDEAAALQTLELLIDTDDSALASKARLCEVEVWLDAGRISEARAALPAATSVSQQDAPLQVFLEAMILLREKRAADAAALFRSLIERPQGQSAERYHLAAAGLAEALLAAGEANEAAVFIISFLQDYPSSPRLDELFHVLQQAAAR